MTATTAAQSFKQAGLFSDKRYPRGLARSGVFTFSEAQLLERHGKAFQQLSAGLQQPENDIEQHFIEVAHGRAEAISAEEKVWLKYQKTLTRRSYTLTSSNRSNSNDDDEGSSDDSDDLDL
ncbi:DUF413 domain-containing protein [Ferrimonas senticii]|uniref:DUF413 domain-containing protein n=1 Tax=Ferrimonas senticii TaxID=394566 RepID=UPI00041089BF|nr:DUF413 domain-containing protein [Ferrimonas senticii]